MFPTGKISRNGTVDYTCETNTPFDDLKISKMLQHYQNHDYNMVHQ